MQIYAKLTSQASSVHLSQSVICIEELIKFDKCKSRTILCDFADKHVDHRSIRFKERAQIRTVLVSENMVSVAQRLNAPINIWIGIQIANEECFARLDRLPCGRRSRVIDMTNVRQLIISTRRRRDWLQKFA